MYFFASKLAVLAESGKSYKNALYSSKHKKKIRSVYFLVANGVKKKDVIDKILSEVGLLKEVKHQLWVARILVTELLWGRGHLPTSSPLFKRLMDHKDKLREALPKFEQENSEDDLNIPRYIRINSDEYTKMSATSFLEKNGFKEIPCPLSYTEFINKLKLLKENEFVFDFNVPNLIAFSKKAKVDKLPPISFIRQDKSSCLVSLLLSPVPGTNILDMCAAPGFKTQHASALIHKMGKIYSVDINKERFKTLQNTCKNFKLDSCVEPLNMDALKLSETVCPGVQYIILDPPCSGTGIVNLLVRHTADSDRLRKLSNLQTMILKHALRTFSGARRLVYSTCSVSEEENEGVVRQCLQAASEYGWSLVPLSQTFKDCFSPGLGDLSSAVLRLVPERDLTNGFFLALFERSVPPGIGEQCSLLLQKNASKEEEDSPVMKESVLSKNKNEIREKSVKPKKKKKRVKVLNAPIDNSKNIVLHKVLSLKEQNFHSNEENPTKNNCEQIFKTHKKTKKNNYKSEVSTKNLSVEKTIIKKHIKRCISKKILKTKFPSMNIPKKKIK